MGKNAPALESFNAGELSPDMAGRVSNEKYPVGCDTLQGFIPRVQGPARRRPGSRYVQPVKNSANRTWLRKFIFSQAQAYQVEFGPNYCRFYTNHGQVQVTAAAYNGATVYAIGDTALSGGVTYYCISPISGTAPPNATYWYALTGTIYEVPTPYTAGMLTNSDDTCGIQIEQSGDVLYIACGGYLPMTLTRLAATKWALSTYWPTDGPFMDQNTANSPALYITAIAGQNNQVTCTATAAIFDPTDVATSTFPGRLVRIDAQYFAVAGWQTAHAYIVGDLVRYNGNTYKALNAATSGGGTTAAGSPPVHTYGAVFDAPGGVQWLYQDSGYGIGRVTGYTSTTVVTLTLSVNSLTAAQNYNFPAAVYGTLRNITGITNANPPVVTSAAHGFSVGDPVYITGVAGMTQINDQMYTITAVAANTFTLGAIDASAYSAYVGGGTAIKNASLRWQLGAWGYGAAAYAAQLPVALAFFGDRLFWGVGINWWGSAPGLYSSHAEDLFSQLNAACAIRGLIAAQEVDAITWMNAANVLLIGTKGGEFGLTTITNTQPLGPGNVQVARQSKYRSRQIRAELIGTSNFYVQASGKKLMAQDYNFYIDRYDSTNQNRLANHIAGYTVSSGIIDISYHSEPYECLWAVRADGVLLGYTFDRTDNVTGWHEHPFGPTLAGAAVVECVSVIPAPDGTRDEVWVIVKRTIGGAVVRSIEYIEKDYETGDAQNTICYVDMSGSYNGVATTTITGLSYLNGETVSVVIDGGGHPDCVVSGGQITLQIAAKVVQVGLAFPAKIITMRPEGGADVGTAQGKMKRTAIVTFRLKNTLGGYAGMAGGQLDLIDLNQTSTPLGQAPPLFNGDVRQSFPGDFELDGRIQISQPQPFPMELIAVFPIITVQEPSPP